MSFWTVYIISVPASLLLVSLMHILSDDCNPVIFKLKDIAWFILLSICPIINAMVSVVALIYCLWVYLNENGQTEIFRWKR